MPHGTINLRADCCSRDSRDRQHALSLSLSAEPRSGHYPLSGSGAGAVRCGTRAWVEHIAAAVGYVPRLRRPLAIGPAEVARAAAAAHGRRRRRWRRAWRWRGRRARQGRSSHLALNGAVGGAVEAAVAARLACHVRAPLIRDVEVRCVCRRRRAVCAQPSRPTRAAVSRRRIFDTVGVDETRHRRGWRGRRRGRGRRRAWWRRRREHTARRSLHRAHLARVHAA